MKKDLIAMKWPSLTEDNIKIICLQRKNVSVGSAPCVKFANILQAAFVLESVFYGFFVLTVRVCNLLLKGNWRKS